jgi:hypothetical protein
MPTPFLPCMSYRHVLTAGDNSQVKNVFGVYNIHLVLFSTTTCTMCFLKYMLIVAHALVFLKIDVMRIITAISSVGRAQTSMR